MNPIATICWIIGCAVIALVIVGAMTWTIRTAYRSAEDRLRQTIRIQLEAPNNPHAAYLARSRAIDEEYRQLVLEAHNSD